MVSNAETAGKMVWLIIHRPACQPVADVPFNRECRSIAFSKKMFRLETLVFDSAVCIFNGGFA